MGYSERWCHLCGVSFNVARIRTADEPEEASWTYYGNDYVYYDRQCSAEGCSNIPNEPSEDADADEEREHIAGPNCQHPGGYAGSRISVAEMKPGLSVRCIVNKSPDWAPEPSDEDFDIRSRYCFTTGTSQGPPSEFDLDGLEPVKHGIAEQAISNEFYGDDLDMWGLPIHPHCFQIFKMLSSRDLGGIVDIDGLWKLSVDESTGDARFPEFPLNFDTRTVSEQYHSHVPGTEYLAADPIAVPGLDRLLSSCIVEHSKYRDVVFDPLLSPSNPQDTFDGVPPEVRTMILSLLAPKDVANLRLASNSFVQMPQSYFRDLIKTEMPWLWEIESLRGLTVNWYFLWNRLHAADGGSSEDEKQRRREHEMAHSISSPWLARKNGSLPQPQPDWDKVQQQIDARIKADRGALGQPMPKPSELRGLRNRRRIWRDVQEVVLRISKYWEAHDDEKPT